MNISGGKRILMISMLHLPLEHDIMYREVTVRCCCQHQRDSQHILHIHF